MRAAIYHGPGNIRVEDVEPPQLETDTDVIVRVTNAAVGQRDLAAYRGHGEYEVGAITGREFVGVVTEVGSEVRTVRVDDLVVSPPTWSCGRCEYCRAGLQSSCGEGGFYGEPGTYGAHGEMVRVPLADGTLVRVPNSMLGLERRILPLAASMPFGYHAALRAGVSHRTTVAVIGDGPIGLCAIQAVRLLGATRVIVCGTNDDCLELASEYGATGVVRKDNVPEAIERVMSMTGGVDSVVQTTPREGAWALGFEIIKDGGCIGHVGIPAIRDIYDLRRVLDRNLSISGGVAPVRAYLPDLLQETVDGRLNAEAILDFTCGIEDIADGFAMMDDRIAIKSHIEF